MDLRGKVALVTGASSGIGLSVARMLHERGAKVALVARTAAKLQAIADELGADVAAFPSDVSDRPSVEALPGRVHEHFGRLDVLVNNAGTNHRGPVIDRSPEELVSILETNLVAPILLTRAALGLMTDGGVVVNVASLAGKVPLPDEATYSASKAGLRAFSRALDTELALTGRPIRVATICPGPVDTGFFGDDLGAVPDIVFSQPMSSADDVAEAVLRAVTGGPREIDVPSVSGKLATAGYLSPRLMAALRPALERRGAQKKRAFMARKRRTAG